MTGCSESEDDCGWGEHPQSLPRSLMYQYNNELTYTVYEEGEIIEEGVAVVFFGYPHDNIYADDDCASFDFFGLERNFNSDQSFYFKMPYIELEGKPGDISIDFTESGRYQSEKELIGKIDEAAEIKLRGTVHNSFYFLRPAVRSARRFLPWI